VTRQHKWLCAGGSATRQHKGPFLLAQSCWRVPRPPAKTGFSRQDKLFLAKCLMPYWLPRDFLCCGENDCYGVVKLPFTNNESKQQAQDHKLNRNTKED
jgi:hypothetical protein